MSEFIKKIQDVNFQMELLTLPKLYSPSKFRGVGFLFLSELKMTERKYMFTVLTKKEVMVHSICDRM